MKHQLLVKSMIYQNGIQVVLVPESILINDKKMIIKKFIGPINESDYQFIKDKINEN